MARLPVTALRVFSTVYALGGVRAAARDLGVVHSAVSRHLAALEAWLGVPLVEPGDARRRSLAFTPQGESLGKASLAAFSDLQRAVEAVRERRSAHAVRVSCAPSFAMRWLLPRLPRLAQAHPRLEVSVHVDQRLVDPDAGDADVVVRMGAGGWPGVACEPFMDDALYPVVSPAVHARRDGPWEPHDLLDHRLLHDRDPHAAWEAWRHAFGPPSLDVEAGSRFASSDLVLRAALQGQGVALARHRLAADDVASGALVRPYGTAHIPLPDAYWLLLPTRRPPSQATQTVVRWLKEEARIEV